VVTSNAHRYQTEAHPSTNSGMVECVHGSKIVAEIATASLDYG
jgi:hypothetical protein